VAKVYYETDGDLKYLAGKTVAILGYGSQGHAHALNLRDSGVKVIVGEVAKPELRAKPLAAGCEVLDTPEAVKRADLISVLIPDPIQAKVYKEQMAPHMGKGKTLLFAHGFNIHYKFIQPPPEVDIIMIAPKSPGHRLRELFTEGLAVPADLFGEQVVLCGGVSELVTAAFETLVEAGYQPEIAYFECLNELKLIVDLIYEGGLKYMRYSVSDTAEYGDYTRGPVVIDAHVRETMKKILADVQNGSFAREWMEESASGGKRFQELRAKAADHLIEKVGSELRKMMAWKKPAEEATAAQAEARR
jgi:ketol-acid reductoisomerase